MTTFRPISNVETLVTGGSTFNGATSIACILTGTTDRTITVSNTAGPTNGGSAFGIARDAGQAQVYLRQGQYVVINKKPKDKIAIDAGTDARGFAVARSTD
tara:strand:+ start:225 stop:527 length:303 start_codon:yes stop_codon:yes gene_type:complete